MKKNILCLLLLVTMILSSAISCTNQQVNDHNDTQTELPAISTQPEQDEVETAPEPYIEPEPEKEPEPMFFNNLSGLPCEQEITTKRPVAVMINNIKNALPQHGIADADIIYECIVEGGITRLMAIYSDYTKLPLIGSVRSSRDYYIDLAQAHDAIYVHCGGSPDAYSAISSRKIDNIDGVNGCHTEASAFWKDKDRVRNMGYEHASMTNGQSLSTAIQEMGFRTQIADGFSHPLSFSKEETNPSETLANRIDIMYSQYAKAYFDYDIEAKTYLKGQFGKAHTDRNVDEETPISFKNILILGSSYQLISGDEKNRLDLFFTGTGNGFYVSNGFVKNIVWKKADRQSPYSLYEQDGITPLVINPGKTYIGITNGLYCVEIN